MLFVGAKGGGCLEETPVTPKRFGVDPGSFWGPCFGDQATR